MTIQKKECFKCKAIKALEEFYKHPNMPDGRVNKCKECNKKDVRKNRKKNIDYYREYDKGRANNPNRVSARELYAKTPAGQIAHAKARKKYSESNMIKKAASTMVGNAVRDKKIIKSPCEICGSKYRIHGHHDDYSKPLSVRWLCSKHHSQWHKENGPGLNG